MSRQRRGSERHRTTRRALLRTAGVAAAGALAVGSVRCFGGSSDAAGPSEPDGKVPPPGAADPPAESPRTPAEVAGTELLRKPIPSTGELVPVLGMGTWITFDVLPSGRFLDTRVEILRRFFDAGGAMIDSSPMYGRAEDVVGRCLRRLDNDDGVFSATKVWTPIEWHGRRQVEESEELWGVERLDLEQIHNMVGLEGHLETLLRYREEGRVRYVGVTTSDGRRHEPLERALREHPFDFVQLTYNILDREAENRLLPLAAERGIAVIANRPFRRKALIERFEPHPLPPWAAEIDCFTWPQFLLKFIVSHPAVTCAIPATAEPDHMSENMIAARGRVPDAAMRRRMAEYVESL